MSDADYDEKKKAGLHKAKEASTDPVGHKPADDQLKKRESLGDAEASARKPTADPKGASDAFAAAKKQSQT